MYKKNDDKEFGATQIRFTALLKTAVHNKKLNYMEKKYNSYKNQSSFESKEFSVSDSMDFVQSIIKIGNGLIDGTGKEGICISFY